MTRRHKRCWEVRKWPADPTRRGELVGRFATKPEAVAAAKALPTTGLAMVEVWPGRLARGGSFVPVSRTRRVVFLWPTDNGSWAEEGSGQ